jgi:hypothetical protein
MNGKSTHAFRALFLHWDEITMRPLARWLPRLARPEAHRQHAQCSSHLASRGATTLAPQRPKPDDPRRVRRSRFALICACLCVSLCIPGLASAEAPSKASESSRNEPRRKNETAAQVLFDAGRRAMERGEYDLACQKFSESQRLQRAVGTLLNLGRCEEERGNIASAWRRYTEAVDLLEAGDRRLGFARAKVEELEPDIPRLTVDLARQAPSDTRVTRNGVPIAKELGSSARLDPGRFVIVAEASGHERRVYHVDLGPGDNERLSVGVGEPLPRARTPDATVQPTPDSGGSTLGYVLLGSGIAAGAAGVTFGALTFDEYQTVREHCDLETSQCFDSTGQEAASAGATYEKLAYLLGGTGLVSLSIGSVLLLSDDEAEARERTAKVSVVLGGPATKGPGIQLSGTF